MILRRVVHATLLQASLAVASSAVAVNVAVAQTARTAADFTVSDIRIEGLQRISEGTVYNYLPVNIGDHLDNRRIQEALRAIYATGFFRDVEIRRDGSTLLIAVLERPSIESFELKGNKDIKTEDLQKSLKNVGLSAGKTFDQSTLDEVKQYLTDQYFSRGKYALKVDAKVEEVPGNKVKVTIDIKEGKRAKIRQVNLVGATAFTKEEIIKGFKLHTPGWLSWYKQDDRYSREEFSGDLELLRSFYMDRGYANFQVDSTQVSIAPEKDDIFITVNVAEGDVFTIGDIKIAGNLVVPEEQLRQFVFFRTGDTYSRKFITASTESMVLRMGIDGYAFAKVDPVPQIDPVTHKVNITLLVEPGNRVYVRRINFNGSTNVNDVVFRREMRQLEGAYLSNAAVDRSKERLRRLPFLEKVEADTKPVPGSADLVDVDFKIKEGLPGQFSAGIGYSETQKFMLNGSFTHSNFMGTGNRVSAEAQAGRYGKVFSLSHTDPYTTVDNVSRTISASYRKSTQLTSTSSDFDTTAASLGVSFLYPITEYQWVNLGLTAQLTELLTDSSQSAPEAVEWVRHNGNTFTQPLYVGTPPQALDVYGTKFYTFELGAGWVYDSRNRTLFADRGTRQRLNFGVTVPGSEIDYWTVTYDFLKFVPLFLGTTLMINADIYYGTAFGDTTGLPPYRQAFAGGPDTVRGFRESRLGPRDFYGNPYGGNLKTVMQTEFLFPMPEKWRNSARISLFYDIGNVFSTENIPFVGQRQLVGPRPPVDYSFSYDALKHSTGVAVQWLAPLGVFRFSYAIPLNVAPPDGVHYPDEREGFQFSIGQAF
jgi:outer membrane protein insertion porin family